MEIKQLYLRILSIVAGLFSLFIIINIFSFFKVINDGERGVLLQFGTIQKIYNPGLHFQLPFINQVITFDVRTQKSEHSVSAASKDLQSISTTVALNYHIDPTKVDQLYKSIGLLYEERIINPVLQESVKAATAQFTAEELITKREIVTEQIRTNLVERLAKSFIIIDDFSIVNFEFSKEFDAAIEAKQTAVQNALKAENDLKRIQIEAQQKIETAKAEAEAIRIQGEALKQNSDLVQLKAVEKWNGVLPLYFGGGNVPLLNLR